MIADISFNLIGAFIFLCFFWRKLREDYISNQIFSTAFFIIFGLILGIITTEVFFPEWWFWGGFTGTVLGFTLGVARYKLRVFEVLEALVISYLPWFGLIFLKDSIQMSSLETLVGAFVIFLLILLFFVIDKHYKRFSWYKSGKVGFTGLSILGIFFLVRAFVAILFADMLSFPMRNDSIPSAVIAFMSFLLIFNLARSET